MRYFYTLLLPALAANLAFAQLTMDQKVSDFQALTALYAKRYGPYEWKRDALKFDLLNIAPWLARVHATRDDLDFYELMADYLSNLQDGHVSFILPANFTARLNFNVDLYDAKLLVDSINRSRLPANEFGFLIGYELVSIDGQDAQKLLDGLMRYGTLGNLRSTRRYATVLLTSRSQSLMPHAADVPEISTVTFRRPDGSLESHRIPWTKTGLPLVSVGRYATPRAGALRPLPDRWRQPDGPAASSDRAPYLEVLAQLQNCRIPDRGFLGYGALAPVFAPSMPTGFEQRLGRTTAEPFYSGVFKASGLNIGYIRIPNYQPLNVAGALAAFRTEIAYFQANTDGLVVDTMRDSGGSAGYANQLLSLLMPSGWRSIPFELRATSEWVVAISSALTVVQASGAPEEVIDLFQSIKDAIQTANREMRGRSSPVPLDSLTIERDPAMDAEGKVIAYTKPLIVLADEMTASSAELFAATIQDNGRGPILGWRTMGAGGSVRTWEAGTYSLGLATVTESLMIRKNTISTADFPAAPYIENIGVLPDIQVDYMTRDNLIQNGKPFVDAFVAAIVAHIQKSK